MALAVACTREGRRDAPPAGVDSPDAAEDVAGPAPDVPEDVAAPAPDVPEDVAAPAPDVPEDVATALPDAAADAAADTAAAPRDARTPDTGPEEGPDDPSVGCLTDADCPDEGAGPQACCTEATRYVSQCVSEDLCDPGRRDACLSDDQCAARRPGQWTVCCHDRGDRNYCAPSVETCQPVLPCETPDDCRGQASETCCSSHPYYRRRLCTVPFFAWDPERDCP